MAMINLDDTPSPPETECCRGNSVICALNVLNLKVVDYIMKQRKINLSESFCTRPI